MTGRAYLRVGIAGGERGLKVARLLLAGSTAVGIVTIIVGAREVGAIARNIIALRFGYLPANSHSTLANNTACNVATARRMRLRPVYSEADSMIEKPWTSTPPAKDYAAQRANVF